jgi:hypothetical protein
VRPRLLHVVPEVAASALEALAVLPGMRRERSRGVREEPGKTLHELRFG